MGLGLHGHRDTLEGQRCAAASRARANCRKKSCVAGWFRVALFGVSSHLATVRLLELRKPVLTPPQSRYLAGMPLLLGSWYGLIGTVIFAMGISARAVQEERKLQRELPGYADYITRVRYRLIPGIW